MTLVLAMAGCVGAAALFMYVICIAEEEWMPRFWHWLEKLAQGGSAARGAPLRVVLMVTAVIISVYAAARSLQEDSMRLFSLAEVSFCFLWLISSIHLSLGEGRLANIHKSDKAGGVAMTLAGARRMRALRRDTSLIFLVLLVFFTAALVATRAGADYSALPWLEPVASAVSSAFSAAATILRTLFGSIIAGVLLLALIGVIVWAESRTTRSADILSDYLLSHVPTVFAVAPVTYGGAGNLSTLGTNTALMMTMLDVLLAVEERADEAYVINPSGANINLCKALPDTTMAIINRLANLDQQTAHRYKALVEARIEYLHRKHRIQRAHLWASAAATAA